MSEMQRDCDSKLAAWILLYKVCVKAIFSNMVADDRVVLCTPISPVRAGKRKD